MTEPLDDLPALKKLEPGAVFGRLTLIERAGCKDGKALWRVECECGNEKLVSGYNLGHGKTISCGCYRKDQFALGRAIVKKHGLSQTPEHNSWAAMIRRCHNKNHRAYHLYGGRGIVVCEQWRSSFETFLKDVGHRPSDKTSIDRIDNDGNYEPGNVRWATATDQVRNSRNFKNGMTHWTKAKLIEGIEYLGECNIRHKQENAALKTELEEWKQQAATSGEVIHRLFAGLETQNPKAEIENQALRELLREARLEIGLCNHCDGNGLSRRIDEALK